MEGGAFLVLPAIFDAVGLVDTAGVERVAAFVLDCGVDGVVFPGLASEYDQLTLDERAALVTRVGAVSQGRAAFIVGASSDRPSETASLVTNGAAAGASAAMVLTPKSLADDLDAIASFYRDLGETLPIMLQNAPPPMGIGLSPTEVARVCEAAPGIRYVKEETAPSGQRITALRTLLPATVAGVFGGAGGRYIIDELSRGAIGTMPAAELPELHVALIAAYRSGDEARARDLYEAMLPILMMQAVFRWDLTKAVLQRRGLIESAYVRAAGPRLDAADHRELGFLLDRLAHLIGEMRATARSQAA